MNRPLAEDPGETSLSEALDRILNRGAVVQGDLMVTVADIELLYLNVRLLLCSVDRAIESGAFVDPNQEPESRR